MMRFMQQRGAAEVGSDEFGRAFGDALRRAREERRWSQRRLAEEIARYGVKLDASAITRIERGTREVKLREANAIARCMHLLLDDLVESPEHDPYDRFMRTHIAAIECAMRARAQLAEMVQFLLRASKIVDAYPYLAPMDVVDGQLDGTAGEAFLSDHAPDFPEVEPGVMLDVTPRVRDLLNQVAVAASQDIVGSSEEPDAAT